MSDGPISLLAQLGPGFAQLQTPKDRANAGEWMPVPGNPHARIRLAYLESDYVARKMFDAFVKRQRTVALRKAVSYDDAKGAALDKLAHATREWDGFGTMACTFENARTVYAELDVLQEMAALFASDRTSYGLADADALEALEGNSAPASATS